MHAMYEPSEELDMACWKMVSGFMPFNRALAESSSRVQLDQSVYRITTTSIQKHNGKALCPLSFPCVHFDNARTILRVRYFANATT